MLLRFLNIKDFKDSRELCRMLLLLLITLYSNFFSILTRCYFLLEVTESKYFYSNFYNSSLDIKYSVFFFLKPLGVPPTHQHHQWMPVTAMDMKLPLVEQSLSWLNRMSRKGPLQSWCEAPWSRIFILTITGDPVLKVKCGVIKKQEIGEPLVQQTIANMKYSLGILYIKL